MYISTAERKQVTLNDMNRDLLAINASSLEPAYRKALVSIGACPEILLILRSHLL